MAGAPVPESFRDLLLRFRARGRITQRDLAARVGVNRRSVQEWEIGATYPSAERLEAVIAALLEARALTPGNEAAEAQALWAAVERAAPHARAPFDHRWFAALLGAPTRPDSVADQRTSTERAGAASTSTAECRQDWGESPDVAGFVGRAEELDRLGRWILQEGCRLVGVVGIGGAGKTSLVARLARELAASFDRTYWRSLRDAPPIDEWMAGAIGFLSDQRVLPPTTESERIAVFVRLLRERRCLVVLDNFETALEAGNTDPCYREGMAGYGRVVEAVARAGHMSCLVLTSRELPAEFAELNASLVRSVNVRGLAADEARELLAPKRLAASREHWAELNGRFGGNALALKLVGETIRELFDGEVGAFLDETGDMSLIGGIRRLVLEQIERSSPIEQHVLRELAIEREPATVPELLAAVGPHVARGQVLEAVQALRRRSLVERAEVPGAPAFALQSVVLEYLTDRLVAETADEIEQAAPDLLLAQPLIRPRAKDYIRHTQERLICLPILRALQGRHGEVSTERMLLALVERLRDSSPAEQGAGPGNLVNLLRLLRGDLRGLDLSRLAIRSAYLAEVEAQDASLAGAQLADCVVAEAFDFPGSVALSPDGGSLAAGTSTGQVWLWRTADRTPLMVVNAHSGAVWGVALSGDGRLVASAGADALVRLWDTSTGQCVATLQAHSGVVRTVALSANGRILASAGTDGAVRVWDTSTCEPLAAVRGHDGGVWRVALSANGERLVSVGTDGALQLWDSTGRTLADLRDQGGRFRSVALAADGQLLAAGDTDGGVLLWDTTTGQTIETIDTQGGEVWGVSLSADGQLLASAGTDGTMRLWDTSSGQPVATLQGPLGGVWGVALSADGQWLVSGGSDGTVRLWDTGTSRPVSTLQGQIGAIRALAHAADADRLASLGTAGVVHVWDAVTGGLVTTLDASAGEGWSVALSADGQLLASGGMDGAVRLWNTSTGVAVASLRGHSGGVRSVALSADGHVLVSGGTDGTVRLWEPASAHPKATLRGHIGEVRSIALSANGRLLASGGADRTIRLWNTVAAQSLGTLEEHAGEVWALALSDDGDVLVSGCADGTVQLWATSTARSVATMGVDSGGVLRVVLSTDGGLVAAGRTDGNVHVWDTRTGRVLAITRAHSGGVPGVAFSRDGRMVATGGFDGAIRLWDAATGALLHTLQPERRYERLDITGLTGVSTAQRAALLALGAVDRYAPAA
jgi:WD40 repeat protein/transcriptional regulator with XRE-family HTH domain